MNNLFKQYGYVLIPTGTLLYRANTKSNNENCTFFTSKIAVASSFGNKVEVWKTTQEIKLLFLVDSINNLAYVYSSIPKLYSQLFNDNKSYFSLDIKQRDLDKRKQFINTLIAEHSIEGWFTSVEDKIDIEICLFKNREQLQAVVLVEIVEPYSQNYFKDSLQKFKIYPSDSFYENTNKQDLQAYNSYQLFIKSSINYKVEMGMNRIIAKHYLYNIRLKLKV